MEDVDPHSKRGASQQLRLYRALAPDVQTSFVNNLAFNAFAGFVGSKDYIGLYAGAGITLHRFFSCFLSDPACLRAIGKASEERVASRFLMFFKAVSDPRVLSCERFPFF